MLNHQILMLSTCSDLFLPSVILFEVRFFSFRENISGFLSFLNANELIKLKPNASANCEYAPEKGMWSAIKNRLPPLITHLCKSFISEAVNADFVGNFHSLVSGRALAITRILIVDK